MSALCIPGLERLWSDIKNYFNGTITPKMDGTAAVGASEKFAREDHVHPHDDEKLNKDNDTATDLSVRWGVADNMDENAYPRVELRRAGASPNHEVALVYYDPTGANHFYTLVSSAGEFLPSTNLSYSVPANANYSIGVMQAAYRKGNMLYVNIRVSVTSRSTSWSTLISGLPKVKNTAFVSVPAIVGTGKEALQARLNGTTLQVAYGTARSEYDIYIFSPMDITW